MVCSKCGTGHAGTRNPLCLACDLEVFNKSRPQAYQVFELLMDCDVVTVRLAAARIQCYSLAARIMELRRMGVPIQRRWAGNGNGSRYAAYFLA